MEAKETLLKIKNEGLFTSALTFEQFVSDLCKRYSRVHGRLLPHDDYDYIVNALKESGDL